MFPRHFPVRRLVHVLILLSVIAGVRACGGLTVAEDRMTANSRWIAERTGVIALRDKWRDGAAPRITGAKQNAWRRVQQATATALERLGSRTTTISETIDSGAAKAAETIKDTVGPPAGARPGAAGSTPAAASGNAAPGPSDAGAP